MTYDERTAAIGTLLRETILPRYRRPDHMDDETARSELVDMVSDINAAWPIMPAERFHAVGRALARSLRMTYTGRSWPTIAHMTKALRDALAPAETPNDNLSPPSTRAANVANWRRSQLLAWCKGTAPCQDYLITRENLLELAKDGEIPFGEIDQMLTFVARNMGIAEIGEAPAARPNDPGSTGFRHFLSRRGAKP